MEMKRTMHAPYAAAVCLFLGLVGAAPVQANTFGGQAFGAYVNVPTVGAGPLTIADTGQLAPDGGWQGAALMSTGVPTILTADVLTAATSGALYADGGSKADSSSSLADVMLFPGSAAQLTASFVQAQVAATATGLQGSSQISDLTFGGVPVSVTGVPNQTVSIPGVGTLIINEQTMTSNTSTQTGAVNALHLILAGGGEVILSSARSAITW